MSDDYGAPLAVWLDVVRRARLGRTVKTVALAMASYASVNGRDIHPGVARLTWETELSYNVVKAALSTLRRVGLVEVVAMRRRGRSADEYRLILAPDVLDHIDVPNPELAFAAIEAIRAKFGRPETRSRHGVRPTGEAVQEDADAPTDAVVQPTGRAVQPVDEAVDNPVDNSRPSMNGAVVRPGAEAVQPDPADSCTAHGVSCTAHGSVVVRPTPWAATTHRPTTTTPPTNPSGVELTATVTDRAREALEEITFQLPVIKIDQPPGDPPDNVINFPRRAAS